MNGNSGDAAQGQASSQEGKRKRGRKDLRPLVGAKNHKPAETREEAEQHERPDAEHIGQDEQREVGTESERVDLVCGYPVHPAAALFPRLEGKELQFLVDDIAKQGLLNPIVLHPDGSVLEGVNRGIACEKAGREPRTVEWDGKSGEELAFVVSQNIRRRHLNESQRAMMADKLAPLRHGQRQTGEFAGVSTQAEAAAMMGVSERTVRTARKVRQEAPAYLARLVEVGRMTLNAAESVLDRLSPEDKQRIGAMSDDNAKAEIERLNKENAAGSKRTMERAVDSQADEAHAAVTPPVIETSAITADNNDADKRPIGAETVSHALNSAEIQADTPERQAFARAIERLPRSDAEWACELMPFVEQEVRRK